MRIACLLLALAVPALAAENIEGSWTVKYASGPGYKTIGGAEFTFHVDGSKLTGMASVGMGWPGPAPISEGTVDGNHLDFMVYGQQWSTTGYPEMHFAGSVTGDKLEISMLRFLRKDRDDDSAVVFEGRRANPGEVNIPPSIGTIRNGRYHHDLTGTEFSPPKEWTIALGRPSSDGGELVSLYQPNLPAEALVWLKPQTLAPEKIADALESQMDAKAKQRANFTGYRVLPTTLEHRTVSGQPAVSAQAEYFENGVMMKEYSTWIMSEKTHIYVSARMPAANFDTVKSQVEAFLATFVVP